MKYSVWSERELFLENVSEYFGKTIKMNAKTSAIRIGMSKRTVKDQGKKSEKSKWFWYSDTSIVL